MEHFQALTQAEQEACIVAVTHDEKIFDRFGRLYHLRDGGWWIKEGAHVRLVRRSIQAKAGDVAIVSAALRDC